MGTGVTLIYVLYRVDNGLPLAAYHDRDTALEELRTQKLARPGVEYNVHHVNLIDTELPDA